MLFFLLASFALPRLFRPLFTLLLQPMRHPPPHPIDSGLVATSDLTDIAAALIGAALILVLRDELVLRDGLCRPRELAALSNLPRSLVHVRDAAIGLVLGALSMAAVVGGIAAPGRARATIAATPAGTTAHTLAAFTVVFVLVGLAEELGVRGFLQTALTRGIGFVAATIVTSTWFALLHVIGGDPCWGAVSTGVRAVQMRDAAPDRIARLRDRLPRRRELRAERVVRRSRQFIP